MDLVDEQHLAGLEVGEHRGQVAGALEHRPRGRADRGLHLAGDDVRQGGLAETGRAEEQHVVETLAPLARRLQEDPQLGDDALLADVLVERARPERHLDREVVVAPRAVQ